MDRFMYPRWHTTQLPSASAMANTGQSTMQWLADKDGTFLHDSHPQTKHSSIGKPELPLSAAYVYCTSALLAVFGLALLFALSEPLRVLQAPDALLGASSRLLLVLVGALHLVVSGCVFATRSVITQAILLLWLGLNCMIYRVGLIWMGVAGPPPLIEALGLKYGFRSEALDAFWKGFIAYLIIGSALVLFSEWRRAKRERAEEFMKNYQKKRRQLNPESGPK